MGILPCTMDTMKPDKVDKDAGKYAHVCLCQHTHTRRGLTISLAEALCKHTMHASAYQSACRAGVAPGPELRPAPGDRLHQPATLTLPSLAPDSSVALHKC